MESHAGFEQNSIQGSDEIRTESHSRFRRNPIRDSGRIPLGIRIKAHSGFGQYPTQDSDRIPFGIRKKIPFGIRKKSHSGFGHNFHSEFGQNFACNSDRISLRIQMELPSGFEQISVYDLGIIPLGIRKLISQMKNLNSEWDSIRILREVRSVSRMGIFSNP